MRGSLASTFVFGALRAHGHVPALAASTDHPKRRFNMRVLLKEGAERATAETILVVPFTFFEMCPEPLLRARDDEPVDAAYIADVTVPVVARAVRKAVAGVKSPPTHQRLYEEIRFMATRLEPYVIGSQVGIEMGTQEGYFCSWLNFSRAVFTTESFEAKKRHGPFWLGL
jgi:hypothetical protein